MQSTACNAAHSVERRFARWLLHAQDRLERHAFALTQELVATMLGVSRPMVSIVAGKLQHAGLITYQRGQIEICDRRGLELVACECYRAAKVLLTSVTEVPNGVPGVSIPSAGHRAVPRSSAHKRYRCIACGGLLVLFERGTIKTRLRPHVLTESYRCAACDAAYVLTPSTGWWKSIAAE
jgi:hypothetical protein